MAKRRQRPRTHNVYALFDRRQLVYYGSSEDVEERAAQHDSEGKRFTRVKKVGPKMTKDSALQREQELIDGYKGRHKGRAPRYNKQ